MLSIPSNGLWASRPIAQRHHCSVQLTYRCVSDCPSNEKNKREEEIWTNVGERLVWKGHSFAHVEPDDTSPCDFKHFLWWTMWHSLCIGKGHTCCGKQIRWWETQFLHVEDELLLCDWSEIWRSEIYHSDTKTVSWKTVMEIYNTIVTVLKHSIKARHIYFYFYINCYSKLYNKQY
jgi:hypothetical protein